MINGDLVRRVNNLLLKKRSQIKLSEVSKLKQLIMREIEGKSRGKLNYKFLIFTLYFIFLLIEGSVEEEFFGEELLIRPLPDGNVLAHLQFTNSYYLNKSEPNLHFSLFPKPLAQIIDKFDVENLQLTFTQGRWNGEEWGAPILDAPHGVQLISSFYNET